MYDIPSIVQQRMTAQICTCAHLAISMYYVGRPPTHLMHT